MGSKVNAMAVPPLSFAVHDLLIWPGGRDERRRNCEGEDRTGKLLGGVLDAPDDPHRAGIIAHYAPFVNGTEPKIY